MPATYSLSTGGGGAHGISNPESQPVGKIVAILIGSFLLQVILAPNIAIGGTSPNFLFIGCMVVSTIASPRLSISMGFVFGLIFDLLGQGPVGAMALILSVVSFLFPKAVESMSLDGIVNWIIMIGVCLLASNLVYAIIMAMATEISFFASLLHIVLPWTVYSLVAGLLGWPLVPHGSKSRSSRSQNASNNTRIKL